MKKIFVLGSLCLIAACSTTTYYPFVGDTYVKGNGGFFEEQVTSKDVDLEKKYPGAKIDFWASGLPAGKRCKLVGYARSSRKSLLAEEIFKHGGNTVTQSEVLLSMQFENNKGSLAVSNKGGNETVSMVNEVGGWNLGTVTSVTYSGYNIFNCK